jgi:hypothetical protein
MRSIVEEELGKSPTGWFGHKEGPSAADVSPIFHLLSSSFHLPFRNKYTEC